MSSLVGMSSSVPGTSVSSSSATSTKYVATNLPSNADTWIQKPGLDVNEPVLTIVHFFIVVGIIS